MLGEDGAPHVLTPLRESYNPLILRVRMIPKPVVAAGNGPAVGIGCSLALAADLAAGPPGSYANIKRTINDRLYPRLEDQLDNEAVLQQRCARSADFKEGILAFMQKRLPAFSGD